jgi:predicted nucleic acid-binding protein
MVKSMSDQQVIYLDTNILVSMLTEDTLSARAIEWFESQAEPLAISAWVCTEFNAVAGLRKRKGELSAAVAKVAIETLHERAEKNFLILNVSNEAAILAAAWLRNPDCNLQTGDALHLAVAHTANATTLATFDERFAKAAQKLKLANLKIVLIGEKVGRLEQARATYKVAQPRSRTAVARRTTKITTKTRKK